MSKRNVSGEECYNQRHNVGYKNNPGFRADLGVNERVIFEITITEDKN